MEIIKNNSVKIILIFSIFLIIFASTTYAIKVDGQYLIESSDDFWKENLTEEQYNILKNKGTDPAFNNKYYYNKQDGLYVCAACGNFLFSSENKYSSGSGWPSFNDTYKEDSIIKREDNSLGLNRTEVICARCGGHLGHLFEDGPEPTNLRYCINSNALKFYQYAYFAHGWFWTAEAQFGALDGVIHSFVGYAGGKTNNPDYNNIGDHAETVKVIYDPEVISYRDLVDHFIEISGQNNRPTYGQYRYIIFYENETQASYLNEFTEDIREEKDIFFEIEKLDQFYLAENYHQKYNLRSNKILFQNIMDLFYNEQDFINSHLGTKLNSYQSKLISREQILDILDTSYLKTAYPEKIQIIKNLLKE